MPQNYKEEQSHIDLAYNKKLSTQADSIYKYNFMLKNISLRCFKFKFYFWVYYLIDAYLFNK